MSSLLLPLLLEPQTKVMPAPTIVSKEGSKVSIRYLGDALPEAESARLHGLATGIGGTFHAAIVPDDPPRVIGDISPRVLRYITAVVPATDADYERYWHQLLTSRDGTRFLVISGDFEHITTPRDVAHECANDLAAIAALHNVNLGNGS